MVYNGNKVNLYSIYVCTLPNHTTIIFNSFHTRVTNSLHYNDGMMDAMASQITSLTIVDVIMHRQKYGDMTESP